MMPRIFALPLTVVACTYQPAGNAMTNAAQSEAPAPACARPKLDLRAARLDAARAAKFATNFTAAFDLACKDGLLADAPLVDPRSADPSTLLVMDAPEANVTSIYFNPEAKPPMTFLEAPFGALPQVPSSESIYEAIYCAVRGATEQEQEELGRCLVD